jgi:excisionase family DNA binding protein
MLMTEERVYTIEEAAALLKVSISTIRRMIDQKQLDAKKVRGQWRIKKSSVDAYL